jgi:hypothetical protein
VDRRARALRGARRKSSNCDAGSSSFITLGRVLRWSNCHAASVTPKRSLSVHFFSSLCGDGSSSLRSCDAIHCDEPCLDASVRRHTRGCKSTQRRSSASRSTLLIYGIRIARRIDIYNIHTVTCMMSTRSFMFVYAHSLLTYAATFIGITFIWLINNNICRSKAFGK